MTTKTSVTNSPIRRSSFYRETVARLLVPLALAFACLALSPEVRADCREGCDVNLSNTFLGDDALLNGFGVGNTAVGARALMNNNTTGQSNTAIGSDALASNTGGVINTAIGSAALFSNTEGGSNTAIGAVALANNTTGDGNTATGSATLYANTTGFGNTATGDGALTANNGDFNTATGDDALSHNLTGINNTASGALALEHSTTGSDNTATGYLALNDNSTGAQNTATGRAALANNTDGSQNTANGFHALLNNTTGSKNIALGFRAGSNLTTGDNNIDIGNAGQPDESSTIRIGRVEDHTATYIAGIAGATVPTGVAVIVSANGHLGTTTSSARYKEAIKPMDKASEAILALKPVTFRYKHELDPASIPQFGLVAEEVEKVNPALVVRDKDGKPYSVRYEAVNAMLLNEFLKEHRKNEEQQTMIERQQKQIDALTAGLQKVSAQIDLTKSAPQTVVTDR